MANVRLVAVGQRMPDWVTLACDDYLPRFRRHFCLRLEEVPSSKQSGSQAQNDHHSRLIERVKPQDFLIVLDERGQQFSTAELALKLTDWELSGRSLVFAIGGPDGWNEKTYEKSDQLWSLSSLVFPHPIARLLVIEQLYRADSIRQGHPYHRS
ncbi:23S rRNA (pseudouridine(1915)-N(3))-methyltransferase RlmH [Litorivicinus sp.]|jgi:23S rRNA (pseudouridine1915-N3)-methyltransferase|nr:23S rRNA (pseudouridine(1915)-N(3))-methyltransferase RlmH [Litorivicinus sp.]MDB9861812.1 23S rRNA (pseudouridine(1915)-N(3))-methyltransferase RlmH [Litorivicinus sp.]MDC1208034.1 23S rRNA (pseudouridine(1915)-N(3))-methyltransferase RlmH [Litorivicinus sp.]MDC1240316.1 23S rRNA (pseudouridine(1915)-N(3))-methyltransferase RlmH [Litorivicinus sp.]MDC1319669.1 23S rRNA (pseudouridine(1915)-N(3))-methyltransferase RlmH [Litorivicinus sp.]|tara:strand:+ start:28687 stop:29148 length:462 start_codon:yes stop_codon:yes gene_type:complete